MPLRTVAIVLAVIAHTMPAVERPSGGGGPAAGRASATVTIAGRPGVVHAEGSAFVDENGPFLALGTTLFWGLWGYEHDRDRLGRNLAAASYAGFDYIRVLGIVGPEGWRDRTVDPRDPRWAGRVAELTDWAYDRYGLRVQWTVFGGVDTTPTPASRATAVERLARALEGRQHKVFAVEVANEGWQNGFGGDGGRLELKRLAARVRSRYEGLLATTAPRSIDCEAQAALYAGSPATLVTLHFPRVEHQWTVLHDAWRSGRLSCAGLPDAYANNEPIGPYSSGRDDRDPLRLAMAAAVSWMSGVGAYVLHTGPGIRGGGAEDRRERRPANIWETENWGATTAALECVRFTLPPDLPAWTRRRGDARDHPFETRAASGRRAAVGHHPAAVNGRRFVMLLPDISRAADLVARRPMDVRVVHPQTCSTLAHRRLDRGDALRLGTDPRGAIVVGQWAGGQASP